MLAFSILNTDIKDFMSKLLKEDTFDEFFVRKVELTTIAKFEITGLINKDFLDPEETTARIYCTWSEIKPHVFGLIKGARKPKSLKIVFSYSDTSLEAIHPNAKALFLNITYENNNMLLTTGTAQVNFSLDKDLDIMWDELIKQFFKDKKIVISTHVN